MTHLYLHARVFSLAHHEPDATPRLLSLTERDEVVILGPFTPARCVEAEVVLTMASDHDHNHDPNQVEARDMVLYIVPSTLSANCVAAFTLDSALSPSFSCV